MSFSTCVLRHSKLFSSFEPTPEFDSFGDDLMIYSKEITDSENEKKNNFNC